MVQDVDVSKPTTTHDDSEKRSQEVPEQQSRAENSGGERLVGLIAFIVGYALLSLVSPINSFGSLFLILLGLGLMVFGFVFMIFGRWGVFF